MLTVRCRLVLPGLGAGLAAALVVPAAAQADLEWGVESEDDEVEVGIELEEERPGSPGEGGNGNGGDTAGSDGGGGGDEDGCEWIVVDPDLAPDSVGERPSPDHELIARACRGENGVGSVGDHQWVESDEGTLAIDPELLAAQAVDSLRLPAPAIAASPADRQLVHVPTWLWIENDAPPAEDDGEDYWQTQTASASLGGVTVTAHAEPVEAVWSTGDGHTVTCSDAGVAFDPEVHDATAESACGHTYRRASSGTPEGTYTVEVTVTWQVTWSGGGESGTEPDMTTTDTTAWPVIESQALGQR